VALIVYTMVVGSSFDIGENDRFKFLIEPLWWTLLLILAQRAVRLARGRYPDWALPRPVVPRPAPVLTVETPLLPSVPEPAPDSAPVIAADVPEAPPPTPKRPYAVLGLLLSALALGGVAVWWRQRKTAVR
jgi:hypothetical protein